jgi:uncharacterized membrane protein (UPF0127 family)
MLTGALLIAGMVSFALPACGFDTQISTQQNQPYFTKSCVRFRVLSQNTSYSAVAELAVSPEEQARGMMYRQNIPDQSAMLFDMKGQDHVNFWMKDTPSSLDIAFFDTDGYLIHLEPDTTPFSTDYIGPDPDIPVSYVLEIPAGQAKVLGLYSRRPFLQVAAPGDCLRAPEKSLKPL